MESDDDYQSFSPSSNSFSPSSKLPKFKRLKKKSSAKVTIDANRDDLIPFTTVDFAILEALESSKTIDFDDSEEQLPSQSPDCSRGERTDRGVDFDDSEEQLRSQLPSSGDFHCEKTDEGMDFEKECVDDVVSEDLGEKIADLKIEKSEKKRSSEGGSGDKKKKVKSVLSLPNVDFAKLEALESYKTLDVDNIDDSLQSRSSSDSFDDLDEASKVDGVPKVTKRVLEFDEENVVEVHEQNEMEDEKTVSKSKKKRTSEGEYMYNEKKNKKKRVKSSTVEANLKEKPSNKRREEKERRAYLEQLHAESQRLLRETSGAGFKPVPVVQKPISSILQKIRQRKLEVSKKMGLSNIGHTTENDDFFMDANVGSDSDKVSTIGGGKDSLLNKDELEGDKRPVLENIGSSLDTSLPDGIEGFVTQSSQIDKSPVAVCEESNPVFRAPIDDTQDLFGDSETSISKNDQLDNQHSSPPEEVLAPSLLTMNLKIDSVPLDDDISSDEEDNDKENLAPIMHKPGGACSSPKGDPVKAFVDDEAEEEDDSDHDLRFQENDEDDGYEDLEELNDLIVTGYEEKSIDNERRNELHQKWLEQQDAAGTDNLMQRLGCGPKDKEIHLLDVEVESDDEDDDDDDGSSDDEDVKPAKTARINARKAKQMIPQMFADKEDPFVSSDDEETEKRLVKQRILDKVGDQATLISPAEDESSREIFGLIKKLNNPPIAKKKQKASSFFDTLITGGSSSISSKSSFLGRVSSHSLPSKKRCSTTRSFIFGRDDSNSRSSISISEDSLDVVAKDIRPTQKVSAKFTSSQAKSITQCSQIVGETSSGTSLFEILKRSSMQANSCNQDTTVGLTQTVFSAFKIPKKSVKVEGRTKY